MERERAINGANEGYAMREREGRRERATEKIRDDTRM